MDRRRFLARSGLALGMLTLALPTGGCGKLPVIGPWNGVPADNDPRKVALSYGMLAPNAHNTQPWLVELVGERRLRLFVDRNRLLPATDPLFRQVYLSQGTFLELFTIGASSLGFAVDVDLFPDGTDLEAPVASLELTNDTSTPPDALLPETTRRRSNKRPYEARVVPEAHLASLAEIGGTAIQGSWFQNPEQNGQLARTCERAMAIEVQSRERNDETARWFRLSDAEFRQHRDGFGLPQSGMTGFSRWVAERFLLDRNKLGDPEGSFARKAVDLAREQADSAPAFIVQASAHNDRRTQVMAGRAFARLQLTATRLGLATHPMSQALQEYAEMGPLNEQLKARLKLPPGSTLQMLVRVGYAQQTFPAPRREVAEIVRRG